VATVIRRLTPSMTTAKAMTVSSRSSVIVVVSEVPRPYHEIAARTRPTAGTTPMQFLLHSVHLQAAKHYERQAAVESLA
jgi:hypothetical protein